MLVAGYAELLLTEGRPEEARDLLSEHIGDYGGNAPLYRLLARAEEHTGNPVAAHMALAEHHYALGDLEAAVAQLERAQMQSGASDYLAARVSARLEQLRRELGPEEERSGG
jgi:predicted Zn-dependent protease